MDIQKFFMSSDEESDEESMSEDILFSSDSGKSEESTDSDDELLCLLLLGKEKRNCVQNYLMNTISEYTDDDFQMHFRVNKNLFNFLCAKYKESEVFKQLDQTKVYSVEMHMALFLWFAGHEACSYRDIADRFDVAISTAHGIILRIIYFISSLSETVIRWPNNEEKEVSSNYFKTKNGLSGVLGAIDGTHIRIDPPKSGKDEYINRKNVCSLHMQGICNEKRKFIDVFIGYPGSVHDNRVLENSEIFPKLASLCGEHYILGDSAYACSNYIITPYRDNGHLSRKQKHFNGTLSSSRVVIEHAFGILKQRFRQLYYCKLKGMKKLCHFIRACVVLHNLCDDNFLENEAIATSLDASEVGDNTSLLPERSSLRRDQLSDELFANNRN